MAQQQLRVRVLANQLANRVPGGTGRYVEELVKALAADLPARATLDVAVAGSHPQAYALGVPVRSLRVPDLLLSRLWERGLPPFPATWGIVHAPTLLVPPASRRYRLVVTIHDVVPWTHPETLTPRGVAFHRRMGARAAAEADLIVTPTQVVADQVVRELDPQARVVAVHSGVTIHPVPLDSAERRLRLGVPVDYVLFVGTAEPRKGLDVLIDAMAGPELQAMGLVVAGPAGWGDVGVADLAERAGIAARTVVTGRVREPELAALYAGARVVVMPSRQEGFGFPVVEGMAHGVPVVTSDDPALVEVGGGAALVAAVGDSAGLARAVAEVADPGERRTRVIGLGRERAAELTWSSTAAAMWRLYAGLAG